MAENVIYICDACWKEWVDSRPPAVDAPSTTFCVACDDPIERGTILNHSSWTEHARGVILHGSRDIPENHKAFVQAWIDQQEAARAART